MATQHTENGAEPERLHSVRRALAVLEALAARPNGATPKELGLALGLHLSTCYRLLNTLVSAGYVVRDDEGLFRLGSRVAYLNQGYLAALHPPPEALPFAQALQHATGETTILSRLEGTYVVSVALIPGSRPGAIPQGYSGMAAPAYAYAAGRVLLAALPELRLERYLAESVNDERDVITLFPPLGPDALRVELEQVRAAGYALDTWGEYGICCAAAPIISPGGAAETSLTVVAPCERFRQEEPALVHMVLTVAHAISTVQAGLPMQGTGSDEAASATTAVIETALAEINEAMSRVS